MRAMRTYAKKKEHVNAPVGPFRMFSHCACGYNIRNELISAAKNTEHQYQYDELDSLASDGGVAYAYDAAGNRTTKTENGETITYTLGLSDGLASWMSMGSPWMFGQSRDRAWEGKREDGEEDTGAPCRRAHAAVCAKGGGRHQEPNPLFQVLPEAADGEGHDRKNRSGQSEIAQTGVQAGMSYYINNTMSIDPFALNFAIDARPEIWYNMRRKP